ncbi:hypothetical protein HYT74_03375 [Candidatus Daviesbacteria bacterium]|nr:hypothetical protein [Candidatus Daviesbacteria bacterium]
MSSPDRRTEFGDRFITSKSGNHFGTIRVIDLTGTPEGDLGNAPVDPKQLLIDINHLVEDASGYRASRRSRREKVW